MAHRIKFSLDTGKSHLEFAHDALAVYEGLRENTAYPNPPIAVEDVKSTIDAYFSAITIASDGSRKAIAERNRLKSDLAQKLRLLGAWVEANCRQDIATFLSSGFKPASLTRVPASALPQTQILKAQQGGVSGEMELQATSVGARHYEARYAEVDADGKPGQWAVAGPFMNSRMTITGLKPGTSYALQVRAFGGSGSTTNWSDSAVRMAV